jgi:hypothetical protein
LAAKTSMSDLEVSPSISQSGESAMGGSTTATFSNGCSKNPIEDAFRCCDLSHCIIATDVLQPPPLQKRHALTRAIAIRCGVPGARPANAPTAALNRYRTGMAAAAPRPEADTN